MTLKRIQLRRTKGWRLPEGAVSVARPTKWGNPFSVVGGDREHAVLAFRNMIDKPESNYPSSETIRAELAGKDLACWCPLTKPGFRVLCHADVLLEIANGSRGDVNAEYA